MGKANITIQFMGTGSSFSKSYGNTSALVFVEHKGTMKRLLIDCGRTTPDDLHSLGYSFADIDAIFITHLHGDHIYGLEEAGFVGRYVLNQKPHLIFPHEKLKSDLWEKVLKGTMMNGDLPRMMKMEDYFISTVVEREQQYFFFNDVMFSVFPTLHVQNKKSYGLIIGEKDFIMYSGDSLLNQELIQIGFENDCQAVFQDCQLFHNEGRVHASFEDLLTLENFVREDTYIMHYGDDLEAHREKIEGAGFKIANRGEKYHFTVSEL